MKRKSNGFLLFIFCFNFSLLPIIRGTEQGENIFLIEAVAGSNLDVMRWLIKNGAYLNVQDERGMTPLMYAATINGSSNLIETLIASGADVNLKDEEGKTALHWAAERGTKDIVELLILNMTNSNAIDKLGRTALHLAATTGNEAILSYLVDQGASCEIKDKFGLTPIHTAALIGNTQLLQIFKDRKIDLDIVTDNGATPLLLASFSSHNRAAKLLLEYGANVNSLERNNWSALHFAASTGNLELVKLLVQKNITLDISNLEGHTPLHLAVINGDYPIALYLIEEGADTLITDNNKNTLIHGAARSGNIALLNFLINSTSDIDEVNNDGNTPLIVAAIEGNNGAIDLLLEHKANTHILKMLGLDFVKERISVNNINLIKNLKKIDATFEFNKVDYQGSTLLHFASRNSSPETVKYILDSMAKEFLENLQTIHGNETYLDGLEHCLPCYVNITNKRDHEGKTSLHYAAEWGNAAVVDILMNFGTDQTLSDQNGLTAFHVAAINGRTEVLKKLVPRLDNLNALDNLGQTALFLSVENGHIDSFEYLMNIGADARINNVKGYTLFHAATINRHTTVLKALLNNQDISKGINITDSSNKSPVWYALNYGYTDIVELFETHRAEMMQDWLCDVVLRNDVNLVKYLVSKHEERIVKQCYGDGKTFFHLAASKGHFEVLKLLIEHSRLVSITDNEGKSPLWYAAEQEKWDCVAELEKAGAEIKPIVAPEGAVESNLVSLVKYFIKKGYNFKTSSIHVASSKGFIAILREFVNPLNKININSLDNNNKTALWNAIEEGQWVAVNELERAGGIIQPVLTIEEALSKNLVNLVKYFLNKGSNFVTNSLHIAASKGYTQLLETIINSPNGRNFFISGLDNNRRSPLWYAIEGGHWESVKVIKKAGGILIPFITTSEAVKNNKINAVKYLFDEGYSFSEDSLHTAASSGYLDMIEKLIKLGVKGGVSGSDFKGYSPLWYAIENGHWECVDLLRKHGGHATPNYSLESAARNGLLNYVKYLIRIGVSPRLNAADGIPIVYWSAIRGQTPIVEFLLNAGADLEAFNPNTKNTMMIIASYYGQCDTVRLLLRRGAFVNRINGSGHSALDVSDDNCKYLLTSFGAQSSRQICHK